MPKVYVAADHAGFELKQTLLRSIAAAGYPIEDLSAPALDPDDDYPDVVMRCAEKVAEENALSEKAQVFGVVIGGSGQGEAMAANRLGGIRAVVFYGPVPAHSALEREGSHSVDGFDIVRLVRQHNDANMLSIGARFVSPADAEQAVRLFISTPFSDAPRHARRLAKF